MKKMHTLTIGGETYAVYDQDAAHIDNTKVGDTAWSSREILERLCPALTARGKAPVCYPAPGSSLAVVSHILPEQNGDPTPQSPCPITGHTNAKVIRWGRNLADITRLLVNAWEVNEEGAYYGSPVRLYDKYHLSRGSFLTGCFNHQTQYTVCLEARQTANDTAGLIACFGYTDGTNSAVQIKGTEYQLFTLTSTAGKTVSSFFFSYSQSHTTYIKNFSICQGTDAPFEPFRQEQIEEDLGQEVYAGTYDWSDGTLTLTHKMQTLTGDEDWTKKSATTLQTTSAACLEDSLSGTAMVHGFCSHVPTVADGTVDSDYLKKASNTAGMEISTHKWGLADNEAAAWKGFLKAQADAGTPVQILYKLQTPVQVALSDSIIWEQQSIIAQPGDNTLQSDTGDTTVTYRGDISALMQKLLDNSGSQTA